MSWGGGGGYFKALGVIIHPKESKRARKLRHILTDRIEASTRPNVIVFKGCIMTKGI